MTFVFHFVGDDAAPPTLLVRSIRAQMPRAEIIQCSDENAAAVTGVTRVFRVPGNTGNLMMFRTMTYRDLGLARPAAYIDADMLMVRPMDVEAAVGGDDVLVCLRSFDRDAYVKTTFLGMEYPEYRDRKFAEAFPYLGCFVATRSVDFWAACLAEIAAMRPELQKWHGDQEALRVVVTAGGHRVRKAPESQLACLPEHFRPERNLPYFLHFKGPGRKKIMLDFAARLGI